MIMLPTSLRNRMDLFSEFSKMQDEVNTLLHAIKDTNFNSGFGVEIWDNDKELVVTAELPGVSTEDIKTMVEANQLTIETEFKDDLADSDKGRYIRKERKRGKYKRTFRLPYDVENDKVTAEYKRGVLTITLPKAEACKPKVIKVKSA